MQIRLFEREYRQGSLLGCLAGIGVGAAAGGAMGLPLEGMVLLAVFGGCIGVWFGYRRQKERVLQRHKEEFRLCLEMMIPVLRSGRSAEGAVDALLEQDLDRNETPWIYTEMEKIQAGIRLSRPIEECFQELGKRSGIQDAEDFADILSVSKRSDGNIVRIMDRTSRIMREKTEAEEELRVILARRKMEQSILELMPAGIYLLLRVISPEYVQVLYTTAAGRGVFAVCIGLTAFSWYLSGRLTRMQM